MSQPPAGSSAWKPAVLFVYDTYTQQTLKVAEEMAGVLRGRGCDVHLAAIEFTEPRYAGRFSQFPMPHPFLEVLGMIPAGLRHRPAEIRIPDGVTERGYDLKTVRRLGTKRGGEFADGIHFRYQGGQVRSLLSLISCLGPGDYRERYLGVKIPPANIQDYHLEAARKFADGLADRLARLASGNTIDQGVQ